MTGHRTTSRAQRALVAGSPRKLRLGIAGSPRKLRLGIAGSPRKLRLGIAGSPRKLRLTRVALRTLLGIAAAGCALAAHPGTCGAWGRVGHQVVALIAEQQLAPGTREKVAALLAPDGIPDLATASTWADVIVSKRPETGPWHYVDIPVTEQAYAAARDCPNEACVVAQIGRWRGVLRAPAAAPAERAEALKFLVHFVADIHQPLHAACMTLPPLRRPRKPVAMCGGLPDSDRGGNEIKVRFGDLGINLHQVWDTELLYELRGSVQAVAGRLVSEITEPQRQAWQTGSAEDWANESHRLAQQVAYGLLPKDKRIVIPFRYETEARMTIELQLKRAGLRLARVLNDDLAASP